jgi:peptide/nickel transport system substrate-binding protein
VNLTPQLATSWKNTSPTTWVFHLRRDVKCSDGTPFTADDVVFSYNRARESGSDVQALFEPGRQGRARSTTTPVEFTQDCSQPRRADRGHQYLHHEQGVGGEAQRARSRRTSRTGRRPYSSRNAMGTGPYTLVSYQAGVKTVYAKNPDWWGIKAGTLRGQCRFDRLSAITNQATRMAALRLGELDFVQDPPVQDIPVSGRTPRSRCGEGAEFRFIMAGFDQARGPAPLLRREGEESVQGPARAPRALPRRST